MHLWNGSNNSVVEYNRTAQIIVVDLATGLHSYYFIIKVDGNGLPRELDLTQEINWEEVEKRLINIYVGLYNFDNLVVSIYDETDIKNCIINISDLALTHKNEIFVRWIIQSSHRKYLYFVELTRLQPVLFKDIMDND